MNLHNCLEILELSERYSCEELNAEVVIIFVAQLLLVQICCYVMSNFIDGWFIFHSIFFILFWVSSLGSSLELFVQDLL